MIVRAVDSLFYPMPDGSIEFYPLGVRTRGFVIASASEAQAIRTRTIRLYRVLVLSFLTIWLVPLMALAILFQLAPLVLTGRTVDIGFWVWMTAVIIGILAFGALWYWSIRRWRSEFERTPGRLTLAMAADNAATRFSKTDVLATGGLLTLAVLLVGERLVAAWTTGSMLDAVVRYLQLWLFLLAVAWIAYVIVRRKRAISDENRGSNG